MPTLYVGRPLLDEVRARAEKLKRERDTDYIPEREALETMFSEDALEAIERRRDDD